MYTILGFIKTKVRMLILDNDFTITSKMLVIVNKRLSKKGSITDINESGKIIKLIKGTKNIL